MKNTAEKLCFSTYFLVIESRFVAQTGVFTMTKLWIMRHTRKYTGQTTLLKGAMYTVFPPFILSLCNAETTSEVPSAIFYKRGNSDPSAMV